jgi:hypothetical protein
MLLLDSNLFYCAGSQTSFQTNVTRNATSIYFVENGATSSISAATPERENAITPVCETSCSIFPSEMQNLPGVNRTRSHSQFTDPSGSFG